MVHPIALFPHETSHQFRGISMPAEAQTILIVDDEPHVVHVVGFKLKAAGFKIEVATNGKDAYKLACSVRPALIITDFQMPGGSGLELATRLRRNADTADTPLIMLTARGHLAPLSELADTNICSLLAKPFSPRNLLKKVQELLGITQGAPTESHSLPAEPDRDAGAAAA